MFRNAYQSGFLSILYSCGSSPLAIWDKQVRNGYIKRITDDEVKSLVLEIAGNNVATTFISCPQDPKKVLGIKLPFLIMIIKNMKKYFTFEITILDDKNMHRRFRVSNFQSTTRVRPFCTTMPIGLSGGWNQIQFNLADFTRRAYGSNYVETMRMQIHANCRIRRIYYADRLYSEDDMPEEFKLFLPIRRRSNQGRKSITVPDKGRNDAQVQGQQVRDEPPPFQVNDSSGTADNGGSEEAPKQKAELAHQETEFITRKSASLIKTDQHQQKTLSGPVTESQEAEMDIQQRTARDLDEEDNIMGEGAESAPEEDIEAPAMTEELLVLASTGNG